MKKILLALILFLIPISSLLADEYSPWSQELPPDTKNIKVKTTSKYLFYEMKKVLNEYVDIENNSKEMCDVNDYIFTDYIITETETLPNENREVIVYEETKNVYFNDLNYIEFHNLIGYKKGIRFSSILIRDKETKIIIPYTLSSFNNIVRINDDDFVIYEGGDIFLELDNTYDANKIEISYTIIVDYPEERYYHISLYDKDNHLNFTTYREHHVFENKSFKETLDDFSWTKFSKPVTKTYYKYRDKLYNCYNLERNDIGYYENLEGEYLKEENPVTFYSYKIIEDEHISEYLEEKETKTEKKEVIKKESYPLKINTDSSKIKNYSKKSVNEPKEKEILKEEDSKNFISYNKENNDDQSNQSFLKIFGIINIILVIASVILVFIYKKIKKNIHN